MIYLDYAAATPVDERVLEAMLPYYREQFYNPSATYLPAKKVAGELNEARAKVAHWLGSRPAEIIFTAGATESTNLAIHGVMQQYSLPGDDYRGNIVISAIEHPAVLEPALRYDCRIVPVNSDGIIDLAALEAAIDEQTVLVSVMYANNEIGTIQPVKEIADIIRRKRSQRKQARSGELGQWSLDGRPAESYPLYFHTDAAQAGNYLDVHISRLGVDMLTLNGGKLYGPKQSGVLYVGSQVKLIPLITGGGQEGHLRSGTENIAQAVGFAEALDIAQTMRHEEAKRLQVLQQSFFRRLEEAIPGAVINGSRKKRLPNNIHVTFPGVDNERLLIELEGQGILAAAGSACSASSDEPSHVLKAIGLSDTDAQSSIRFTMGRETTEVDIENVVKALQKLITK